MAAEPTPPGDPPQLRGLLLMLAATAAFTGMAAFVKLAREDGMSTPVVMFWRMAPGLLWVGAVMWWKQIALRPERAGLMFARCLFGIVAMSGYFWSARQLTLVQYAVLHLLQPIFIAVLAPVVLGERLRRVAIFALALALAGAVLVIRPDGSLAGLPLLAGLAAAGAALASAFAHMSVRRVTQFDAPERVVLYFTLTVTLLAGGVGLASGELLVLPAGLGPGRAVVEVLGMAGFGLAGQLLMTRAYRVAQAPLVAIVSYASVPMSFALDLLAWGVLGGLSQLLGAALTVAAGILLVRGRGGGKASEDASSR